MTDEAERDLRAPEAAAATITPLDARRRRALFRATHRGTKEADRLIGGFVAPLVATMDDAALDAVERVLAIPDPDLSDWLLGRAPVPPAHDTPFLRALLVDAVRPRGAVHAAPHGATHVPPRENNHAPGRDDDGAPPHDTRGLPRDTLVPPHATDRVPARDTDRARARDTRDPGPADPPISRKTT